VVSSFAALEGVCAVENFPLLMLRKIYTYNAASAIIAYLGAEKGIEEYAQAANDPEIESEIDAFYCEINKAISMEYGIPLREQIEFAALSKAKFQSYEITDSVSRNAANPERKLGPKERLIAPARLIANHGEDPSPLFRAAAAALRYMKVSSKNEAAEVLKKISLLTEDDPFMAAILKYF
jgi:mannitol-1-phosphate 5-dehydrogenase